MASPAQIAANRANAKKSTGPRTPRGKSFSSENAVTHGLTATKLVLKNEDQEHFDELRTQLLEDLNPQCATSLCLAEEYIRCYWALMRSHRFEKGFWDHERFDCIVRHGIPAEKASRKVWEEFFAIFMKNYPETKFDNTARYHTRIQNAFYKAHDRLQAFRRDREKAQLADQRQVLEQDKLRLQAQLAQSRIELNESRMELNRAKAELARARAAQAEADARLRTARAHRTATPAPEAAPQSTAAVPTNPIARAVNKGQIGFVSQKPASASQTSHAGSSVPGLGPDSTRRTSSV